MEFDKKWAGGEEGRQVLLEEEASGDGSVKTATYRRVSQARDNTEM